MSWFKKARKSLRKTVKKWGEEIGDASKPVGKVLIKTVKYGGGFAISLFPGIGLPAAVAIGAGSQGIAGLHRAKNKKKAFFRSAVAGAGTVLAVKGATSILGGLSKAGSSLTGGSGGSSALEDSFIDSVPQGNGSTSPLDSAFLSTGGGSGSGSGTSGLEEGVWNFQKTSPQTSILGDIAKLGVGFGAAAGSAIGGRTGIDVSGLLPTITPTSPSDETSGGPSIPPVVFIGGAILLLWLMMRKGRG